MNPSNTPLTGTQVIRKALRLCEDPETATPDRLLTLARAELSHNGQSPDLVDKGDVVRERSRIRCKLGKPLTREKVEQFEASLDPKNILRGMYSRQNKTNIIPPTNGKPATHVPQPTEDYRATITLNDLKDANVFASTHGGLRRALAILQALQEITTP